MNIILFTKRNHAKDLYIYTLQELYQSTRDQGFNKTEQKLKAWEREKVEKNVFTFRRSCS